jgi:hypothetical protein
MAPPIAVLTGKLVIISNLGKVSGDGMALGENNETAQIGKWISPPTPTDHGDLPGLQSAMEMVMDIFVEVLGTGNVDIVSIVLLLTTTKLVGRRVFGVDIRHFGRRGDRFVAGSIRGIGGDESSNWEVGDGGGGGRGEGKVK